MKVCECKEMNIDVSKGIHIHMEGDKIEDFIMICHNCGGEIALSENMIDNIKILKKQTPNYSNIKNDYKIDNKPHITISDEESVLLEENKTPKNDFMSDENIFLSDDDDEEEKANIGFTYIPGEEDEEDEEERIEHNEEESIASINKKLNELNANKHYQEYKKFINSRNS